MQPAKSGSRKVGRPPRQDEALTPAEIYIIRMIADGLTSKQIAMVLGRSVKTIESHRCAAMRKAKCCSIAHLVRYAVRTGIIEA